MANAENLVEKVAAVMSTVMRRVALYVRVSTKGQDEKNLSIPAQIKELTKVAAARGWTIVGIYRDGGKSAKSDNRPEFQRMIRDAKKGEFDKILVWSFSRFARNRNDSVVYKTLLRKKGVDVVSATMDIEDSPVGRMLEGIIEIIDEFYSNNLAADTFRGMCENAERGFVNGGMAPYGYLKKKIMDGEVSRNKLEPDPTASPVVKRIYRLADEGMGCKEIAKLLNKEDYVTASGVPWTKTAVRYLLANEVYMGDILWNREGGKIDRLGARKPVVKVENAHPALVSRELFYRVAKKIEERSPEKASPGVVGSDYLLSGLVKCADCGSAMCGSSAKSGRYNYYSCQKYIKEGRAACGAGQVPREKVDAAVLQTLTDKILTEENLSRLVQLVREEMSTTMRDQIGDSEAVKAQVETKRRVLNRLEARMQEDTESMDLILPSMRKVKEEIEDLQRKFNTIMEMAAENSCPSPGTAEMKAMVAEMHDLLLNSELHVARKFIQSVVKQVICSKEKVEVKYRLPWKAMQRALGKRRRGRPPKDSGPLDGPFFMPDNKVLFFGTTSSPSWTRTSDNAVNSRVLYQLSYRGSVGNFSIIGVPARWVKTLVGAGPATGERY
jgi:site-specific DNA recombinase